MNFCYVCWNCRQNKRSACWRNQQFRECLTAKAKYRSKTAARCNGDFRTNSWKSTTSLFSHIGSSACRGNGVKSLDLTMMPRQCWMHGEMGRWKRGSGKCGSEERGSRIHGRKTRDAL